jgi:hypothetical protein
MFCNRLCMQGGLLEQVCVLDLLNKLFRELPCFNPAAIKSNVSPGVINFLCKARMEDGSCPEKLHLISTGQKLCPQLPQGADVVRHQTRQGAVEDRARCRACPGFDPLADASC